MLRLLFKFLLLFGVLLSYGLKASEIKILSWNIYQIPKPFLWTQQGVRAKEIGEQLKKTNYDIIFFQEAFAPRARKKIYDRLQENYPYESGTFKKKKIGTILNSGLWAVSPHPIKVLEHIYFPSCKAMDCFATKGALLIEITLSHRKVQILGTHLQAGEEGGREEIRKEQLKMIREILDKYKTSGVEQIVLGDLNVDYYSSTHYSELLDILEVVDHELSGNYLYSAGEITNSFSINKHKRELLDYILLRTPTSTGAYLKQKKIVKRVMIHKKKELDLSDHYAIEAIIKFPF